MGFKKRQPLGVELAKKAIVTQGDIEKAIQYQKEHPNTKLGDCLYELDVCDPKILIDAIAEVLNEKGIIISEAMVKIKITDYISLDIAKKTKVVPFEISNGKIKVCFADNVNTEDSDKIRLLLLNKGLIMDKYITFEKDIMQILKNLEGTSHGKIDSHNANENTSYLLDTVIKTGMEKRASDIHIEPLENEVRIRYRIDR